MENLGNVPQMQLYIVRRLVQNGTKDDISGLSVGYVKYWLTIETTLFFQTRYVDFRHTPNTLGTLCGYNLA